ncbi:glycosyltransferase [Plantibacter sp. VKM Ac-2885]|uniref:glycosyltransferase family 2 protein n=1 Tax=Plantibacter TaxID=190323 RepID=UPI0010C23137|nr:glycosyltransferase [Plantibacter flavus]MBD8103564.1 glycosyltransferase [Plantibacter sp. CFBP 8775]MBD8516582.1 glycosyltransferase [Plantibacter sp. CFBP 8804]MBF4514385.1 glycosyltransferase [Plantibacter sp. VKM Ac-2885]TKJ96524.1 hypothetical protein PlfCFBP13513_13785 [Plantibacter flavus]
MAVTHTDAAPFGLTFILSGLTAADAESFRSSVGTRAEVATVVDGDIDALNAAVQAAPTPYVSVLSRPGILVDGALDTIRTFIDEHPDTEVLYTDEAVVLPDGSLDPVLKPEPAAERLRNQYFWGDLVLVRRETLERLGGFGIGYAGAHAYEFALRATRGDAVIGHLAATAFVPSGAGALGDFGVEAAEGVRRALEEHLAATGGGSVLEIGTDGVHHTVRAVQGEPLVSIVIPTRGQYLPGSTRSYLVDAIESIVERSTYERYEFVVVIDDVADAGVVERITETAGSRLHLVPWTESFNFSGKINLGVLSSIGEYVLILNDDVSVITPNWIEDLLALAQLPNAGMSGCMLYYEDDTIQHAGHHYWRGDTIHVGMQLPRGTAGPTNGYRVEREVVGITAACAMMPRSVYLEVGGMTTLLPGAFNDVDLCLKVLEQGYDILWTPHAELYHYESKTRDARVRHYEVQTAWGRWEHKMHQPGFWPYPV